MTHKCDRKRNRWTDRQTDTAVANATLNYAAWLKTASKAEW